MFSLIVQSFPQPMESRHRHTRNTLSVRQPRRWRVPRGRYAWRSTPPVVVVDDPIEASKNAVEAMPRVTISHSHSHDQYCSICFQEFKVGEEAPKVPCSCQGSYFHPLCLQTWLGLNASCPLCRFHVELMPDQDKTKTKD